MALVDDQCPECAYGSIDLALTGDGRWKTEWYPVEVQLVPARPWSEPQWISRYALTQTPSSSQGLDHGSQAAATEAGTGST